MTEGESSALPVDTGQMPDRSGVGRPGGDGNSSAGLVLLYAPCFEHMAPAYVFQKPGMLVGRGPQADVCVPHPFVSEKHAWISLEGDQYWIQDTNSRNGTFVDGHRVSRVRLEPGAEVRVGMAVFKYVAHSAEGYLQFHIDGGLYGLADREHRHGVVGGYTVSRLLTPLRQMARGGVSILVLGETGTGKEAIARFIHGESDRKGRLVAINCTALPTSLIESELFGAQRGAYSGSDRDRPGLIRSAHGGTLLLDEVGDMPLEAQGKLLRVLETREVTPVGGVVPYAVDIQVVCATNADLPALVLAGRFRGDLYARIRDHSLTLPRLADRKEDIYMLSRAFIGRNKRPEVSLSDEAMIALLCYDFPRNVRELERIITTALLQCNNKELGVEQLSADVIEAYREADATPQRPSGAMIETGKPELVALLKANGGSVAEAAKVLGKSRTAVYRMMDRWGIPRRRL